MENDLISRQKLIDDLEAWRKRLDRRVSRFDDMVIHALPAVFDLVNEQETVEAKPKWISVKERLPEDYKERVLVMLNDDCIVGYPRMDTDRWCCGRWVRYGENITHWMPLPEPPKDGGAEDV